MIGTLRGYVQEIRTDRIILDVRGIGFIVYLPTGALHHLQANIEKMYYTHQVFREDDVTLYGFDNLEEKELFIQLLSVSGIGPKAGLGILSAFSVNQIKTAIRNEDVKLLTEVPGIGAKTAKRLILELKEKMKDVVPEDRATENQNVISGEALESLLALGFTRTEAREALEKVSDKETASTEQQIKSALKLLVANRDRR